MELGLKGKVAVITGGTQGIGKATAQKLAAEGASVVIVARGQEGLDAVAAEIRGAGGKVATVSADVSKPDDCDRVIAEAVKAFGGVDILVNNAGTSATGAFESVTDGAWQADFDLKLLVALRTEYYGRFSHEFQKRLADVAHISDYYLGDLDPDTVQYPDEASAGWQNKGAATMGVKWTVWGDPTAFQLNVDSMIGACFATSNSLEFLMVDVGPGVTYMLGDKIQLSATLSATVRHRKGFSYGGNLYAGARFMFD